MNNISKRIKRAFSLLELTICILIVSIIVVVCVPLVMDQMKKTNEYAYFLGFKTVEKLGSQIVAFGDPSNPNAITYNKQNILEDSGLSRLIAKKLENFADKITPQANAITQKTILVSFPSYEYDTARLCNGNTNVVKDYMNVAGMEFTEEEINSLGCDNNYLDADRLNRRFSCNGGAINVKSIIGTTGLTPEEFCSQVASDCATAYSGYQYGVGHEYKIFTLNQSGNRSQYGQCTVFLNASTDTLSGAGGSQTTDSSINTHNLLCNDYGYSTGINDTLLGGCSCSGVAAINHPHICCEAPANNNLVAYSNDAGECINCRVGAYNEETGECCPDNSFYSRTVGHCACAQGYYPTTDGDGATICDRITPIVCPTGFHAEPNANDDNAVCVVNPPITKASKFCELIATYYNVTQSNCGTFNDVETFGNDILPVSYNESLYNAITANGVAYLSAKAVNGAFNNIDPNITFSNGLKLWILGDKVASIAGLSFNPIGYTPNINVCVNRKVYTKAECDNAGDNHYFCRDGNNCYTLNSGETAGKLEDARSCCPTVDYEDLQQIFAGNTYLRDPRVYAINGFTVFVDITGDKDREQGGGTLWKDVFPFYVSSNGTVYPGYPLDANKDIVVNQETGTGDMTLYQGGNSSALNSDVYYYEIVGGERKKRLVYTSIPYSRAQCFALQVSAYTPYCQNLGTKIKGAANESRIDKYIYGEHNPCWQHRCYIHVKNKIKFL